MGDHDDQVAVLGRGLDQLHGLMSGLDDDAGARRTPCEDWTVTDLQDHVVHGVGNFARTVRGEEVDWTQEPEHLDGGHAEALQAGAEELMTAWQDAGEPEGPGPDMQTAEVAVHTYDLATATGTPTADLDQEVAERGLAFMQANLKEEMREGAFGREQLAPDGADAYQRIAAFAGREVS